MPKDIDHGRNNSNPWKQRRFKGCADTEQRIGSFENIIQSFQSPRYLTFLKTSLLISKRGLIMPALPNFPKCSEYQKRCLKYFVNLNNANVMLVRKSVVIFLSCITEFEGTAEDAT